MRVWVDCTAAAHPLVLRPIVERLRERGHDVEITTREYGQTVGILERLGLEHTVVGRHGGGSTASQGRARSRPRSAALRAGRGRSASTSRSPTDRSTSRSSRRVLRDPVGADAGLRARGPPAQARLASRPPGPGARRDPGRGAWRGAAPREEKLVRYPGLKEDYYLADFEPSPRVLSELGLPSSGSRPTGRTTACSWSCARRPRRPPTTRRTPSTRACSTGSPRAGRCGRRPDPAHRGTAERGERREPTPASSCPREAIDAQSLIAYADLVVSAGGTMNREAVALGTPVARSSRGSIGAVDAKLDARRAPAAARRPGVARAPKARRPPPGFRIPAMPTSSSTGSSEAVG